MYTESDIANLRAVIKNSVRAVFFGGAGVSTESGIPDFRSEDGLYRQKYKYPPETMLSSEFFWSHTEEFYDFYRDKMLVTDVSPNAAHDKLAEWEREGHISAIVTQNIDGLHQKAGSKNVYELHGSPARHHCLKCRKQFGYAEIAPLVLAGKVPRCGCGGLVKPDIVFYGENLDEALLNQAFADMEKAELVLVLGSSLTVQPAASLPMAASSSHIYFS